MTDGYNLLSEKRKRYMEEKSVFLLISTEEEFDAYMNKTMDKIMVEKCINICCRYHLVGMFNELAQDYGELLEEIVKDIEEEMESAPCVSQRIQAEADQWYEDGTKKIFDKHC